MASMSGMTKVLLNVDIMNGKLTIIKSSKESVSEKNVFTHDRSKEIIFLLSVAKLIIFT